MPNSHTKPLYLAKLSALFITAFSATNIIASSSVEPEDLLTQVKIDGRAALQSCTPDSPSAKEVSAIKLSATLVEIKNGSNASTSETLQDGNYKARISETASGYMATRNDYRYRTLSLGSKSFTCAYVFK